MREAKDPILQKAGQHTLWLNPTNQNECGTWTYAYLMVSLIENAHYSVLFIQRKIQGRLSRSIATRVPCFLFRQSGLSDTPCNNTSIDFEKSKKTK